MHEFTGLGCSLKVMAILPHLVDVHLIDQQPKQYGLDQGSHTTGVSYSYRAFHFSCLGAITLISVYSKGRRSQTLDMTPFASSQSEQFERVKKVNRVAHCRRAIDARIFEVSY